MNLKDSDGYEMPDETETVGLRKIRNNSVAYYDDTINCDTALTPLQLKNRKRASMKLQQPEEPVYDECFPDLKLKPLPPPKPRRQKSTYGTNKLALPTTKPLNETILSQEFPQIPEQDISVILSISEGNLKEARKDVKFQLFREKMQADNPMLQSVLCYKVLKEADYDIDRASKEILKNHTKADRDYEMLS